MFNRRKAKLVYCKFCTHRKTSIISINHIDRCYSEIEIIPDYLSRTSETLCSVKNKDNNCGDFNGNATQNPEREVFETIECY